MIKLLLFFICGAIQFCADGTIFLIITYFGIGITPANFISRALAACLGYYINGRFTFERKMNKIIFFKFVLYWCLMTSLSTILIYLCNIFLSEYEMNYSMAASKVVVEVLLFFVSYIIAKVWVYKDEH
ncbi:membrane protein [Aeromonas enteropelogenes]|uniref:GtrA family protein n=1 Tax=Aeromonas enteropelogenes TaxID=29489 RepID=UPI002B2A7FEA|nr:membrane protein [Aeromonas enteropelogenes]BEE21090.1 membrane protein [Aeromonas enteropelogenes]